MGAPCSADEAQFLMMPGEPGGGINTKEAAFMREVVLKSLLLTNARNQVMVLTGSTMALMQALANTPVNGRCPMTAVAKLQLPHAFPTSHMKARLVQTAMHVWMCMPVLAGQALQMLASWRRDPLMPQHAYKVVK